MHNVNTKVNQVIDKAVNLFLKRIGAVCDKDSFRKLLWSSIFVTLVAKKYRFMQFELDMVFVTH